MPWYVTATVRCVRSVVTHVFDNCVARPGGNTTLLCVARVNVSTSHGALVFYKLLCGVEQHLAKLREHRPPERKTKNRGAQYTHGKAESGGTFSVEDSSDDEEADEEASSDDEQDSSQSSSDDDEDTSSS